MPTISLSVNKSVQVTFVSLAGVSVGYVLWKWLSVENTEPQKRARKKKSVPGLVNVGNSCFMNALLQAFASCPSFVKWLEEFIEETKNDKNHVYLAQVILKILKILMGDDEVHDYYFDPSELLQDMGDRGWQISSQEQDTHEFYHAVMTTLMDEYRHHVEKSTRMLGLFEVQELLSRPSLLLPVPEKCEETSTEEHRADQTSSVNNPSFRGTLACVLQCEACGYQNPIRYDGFDSLSLSLPSNLSWMAQISLVDCLRSFTAPELVHNVECVNCARLQNTDTSQEPTKRDFDVASQSNVTIAISKAVKDLSNSAVMGENPTDNANDLSIKDPAPSETHTSIEDGIAELPDEGPTHSDIVITEEPGAEDENDSATMNMQVSKEDCITRKCSKMPFPKLKLVTQKESFDEHFRRKIRKDTNSGFDFIYPSVRRTCQRRLCLGKLPDCLCMHIQRLVWVQGTPMKKMNFIRFPEILDVGPFTEISRINGKNPKNAESFSESIKTMTPTHMQNVLLTRRAGSHGDSQEVGVARTPPLSLQGGSEKSLETKKDSVSFRTQALYKLTSVIVHVGDWSFSGHFFTYRRSPEPSKQDGKTEWIFASDTMVRKATREEVFSCPAYMLFYERVKS